MRYEVFFSTDGKQLFLEDVQVSAEASQGQQLFLTKLEQSEEGQSWSVDAEFAKGESLAKAEEKGGTLNTPPRQGISHGKFSKTEFVYEAETDTYTCSHGEILRHCGTNHKLGERHCRPASGTCETCPLRESCTRSKTGRTVTRNRHEAEWERQWDHARAPEAVMGKVLRGIIAEGKCAEAGRHGLKTMRYVGQTDGPHAEYVGGLHPECQTVLALTGAGGHDVGRCGAVHPVVCLKDDR